MSDNENCEPGTKAHVALQIDVIELESKIDRVADGIDHLKERQEEMMANISKIKEAVYNPEQGIYARIREIESWKKTHSKLMWMIVSSLVGLVTAAIFTNVIG
tara:strand:- start:821 stop:1129 length:309 start_codon:yes stop_codon:yes gene_type:complete